MAGNLIKGSQDPSVRLLQERLKEFGCYDHEITGVFDDNTEDALKSFQRDDGLSPDGIAGLSTFKALDLLELAIIDNNE